MYSLYTDKNKIFSCEIDIKGGSLSESDARIVIETDDNINLLYRGKINESGLCEIDIEKMKYLPENTKGKIKLEVITEGSFFIPWESDFIVETARKVTIKEVYDTDKNEKKVSIKLHEEKKVNQFEYLDKHVNKIKNIYESDSNKFEMNKLYEGYKKILKKKNLEFTEKEENYIKNKIIK